MDTKKLCGLRSELIKAEKELGIRILHVAECDSRAWGFSTDESDYDLRFIYVRLPWERTMLDTADTRRIKFWIDGAPVDMQGFELPHVLRKISQSAMGMHEMIHSPIVLATDPKFNALFKAALEQYTDKRDVINFCRGLMRKNFEFVKPMDAKHMLHALRFGLIAERLKNGGELELNLQNLLAGSTGFAPMAQEILNTRKDHVFEMPELVGRYLYRMTHLTEWPAEEKHTKRDAAYFADLDHIYKYITKLVCTNHEGWCVDDLQWADDNREQ